MEGRDIGTVVFPDAQVKIFLDAEPGERARRRAEELRSKGHLTGTTQVAEAIEARDKQDRQRAEAPLVQAPDAELVDSTGLSIDQVEDAILRSESARIQRQVSRALALARSLLSRVGQAVAADAFSEVPVGVCVGA
jgi:cytidylate kinase